MTALGALTTAKRSLPALMFGASSSLGILVTKSAGTPPGVHHLCGRAPVISACPSILALGKLNRDGQRKPRGKNTMKFESTIRGGFVVATMLIASCGAESSTSSGVEATAQSSEGVAAAEEAPGLTRPQKNAVRSARQYLSMTGFSRDGLIQQLSSSAGEGYDVADATVAVDSLDVDWNENAARSAEQYLSMMGFSCRGLIEQLSSSAGEKYTESQARYGAEKAGACS